MNMRKKTIIVICLIILVLTSLLHIGSRLILGKEFKKLEEQYMKQHVQQGLGMFQNSIYELDNILLDWSQWDDTYNFINNPNKEYIKSNLSAATLAQSKLNLIFYIDHSGKLIFKGSNEIEEKKVDETLKDFKAHFLYKDYLKYSNKPIRGIIPLEKGFMAIAGRPILRSDGTGPTMGMLIMGRYIGDKEIDKISNITQLTVKVEKVDSSKGELKFKSLGILEYSNIVVSPLNKDTVIGYSILKDLYGKSSFMLEIEAPRDMYNYGEESIKFFNMFLLISGVIVGIITLLLLEKAGLSRLQKLTSGIKNIEESMDLSIRIPVDGKDELATFASVTNRMLDRLRDSREELLESENKYRHLFESMINPFAYYEIIEDKESGEIDYTFLEVNSAYEKLTGLNKEYIIGKSLSYVSKDMNKALFQWVDEFKNTNNIGEKIKSKKYLNIGERWYLSSAYRPEENYIITIYQDITELILTENELREAKDLADDANKAKSEFLANMSHEIRTPINAIIGMAELLKDNSMHTRKDELVTFINDAGNLLLNIVNDVLDFSKMEAKKFTLDSYNFNIYSVFQNITDIMSIKANQKGLTLKYNIPPNIPNLYGDGDRLYQILLNLLTNAVKFTEKGEITLKADIEKMEKDSIVIKFKVIDRGIGLNEETQKKLFQPFVQGDASTTRKYGGTGLGLSICKELAELMGGKIGVKSAEGHGSTFWFTAKFKTLKYLEANDNIDENLKGDIEQFDNGDRSILILLAEDNEINRRLAAMQLNKLNVAVHSASNGEEAVKKAFQNEYSLILMDCQMPVMDGFEAAKEIRRLEKESKRHTPIVAMTANSMEGDRERCIEAGMDDYMAKPVRLKDLQDIITRWCIKK